MHDSDVIVKPSLLAALDAEHRISSKWIAKETGKKHFHVVRDVDSLISKHPNLDALILIENDSRNQVIQIWIPLEAAILLLAGYTGPRAVSAQTLIMQALHYLIHRAPYVEARLAQTEESEAWLRNENQSMAARLKPATAKANKALRRTVANVAGDLIGGMVLDFSTKPLFEMTDWQLDIAHLPSMLKASVTLRKRFIERLRTGRQKFLSHMTGLGVDTDEAEEAFNEAVRIMCKNENIDIHLELN